MDFLGTFFFKWESYHVLILTHVLFQISNSENCLISHNFFWNFVRTSLKVQWSVKRPRLVKIRVTVSLFFPCPVWVRGCDYRFTDQTIKTGFSSYLTYESFIFVNCLGNSWCLYSQNSSEFLLFLLVFDSHNHNVVLSKRGTVNVTKKSKCSFSFRPEHL